MGIFDGCLLASDVDDTLVSNGEICQRNIDKINSFSKEGGIFSIATGRAISAVSTVTNAIPNISPSVFFNGSVIYDFNKKTVVNQIELDRNTIPLVKKVIEQFPSVGIEYMNSYNTYLVNYSSEAMDHIYGEKMEYEVSSYENVKDMCCNKIIYAPQSQEDYKKVYDYLTQENHNCEFLQTTTMIYGKRRYYIEQIPKCVSKATMLKTLCDIYNIKKGYYFAIGDYYNDLQMIKSADFSAVTADAPEDLKEISSVVVGSAEDGAVADFIDLIKERIQSK